MGRGNWAQRLDGWIRRNPGVILLVLATLLVSSMITIVDGVSRVRDLYQDSFSWRDLEYDKLTQLRAGMSIDKVEEILGSPLFVRESGDGRLIERTFRGRDYWVQAVHDPIGTVKLVAVTSCDFGFKPTFSTLDGHVTLQESAFAALAIRSNASRYFVSGATANSFFFDEFGGGNPGNYKSYLLGINDACPAVANYAVDLALQTGVIIDAAPGSPSTPEMEKFRSMSIINTYAETDVFTEVETILHTFQVGVDRVLIRTVDLDHPVGICALLNDPCPGPPDSPTPLVN